MKMEVESPPGFGVRTDDEAHSENISISELISDLRTAFRVAEFDRVEEILVLREEKLKKKLLNMEASLNFEQLEKIKVEFELKKSRAESGEKRVLRENFEAMQERVKVAEERAKVAEERLERLLKEVKKEEGDKMKMKELVEKVKMADERVDIAEREFRAKEANVRAKMADERVEMAELREKNRELESAKARADEDIKVWKSKFGEMEKRVSKLEADTEELLKVKTLVSKEVDMDCSGCNKANGEKGNGENGGFAFGSRSPPPSPPSFKGKKDLPGKGLNHNVGSDSPSPSHPSFKGSKDLPSKGNGKFASEENIVIIDSDDDCAPGSSLYVKEFSQKLLDKKPIDLTGLETRSRVPKRKRSSSRNTSEDTNQIESNGSSVKKTGEESSSPSFMNKYLRNEEDDLNFEVSSCSSDSDSDLKIDPITL